MRKLFKDVWQAKEVVHSAQTNSGKTQPLSRFEFEVLAYIGSHRKSTITSIGRHPIFVDDSISSIKRTIAKLMQADLIMSKTDTIDKRLRILTLI
jgi:DNA-binding MarR family transcriptional regulator